MFEIGQYVMKANTGVCRVVDISTYHLSEEEDDDRLFYHLSPYGDERARLYVPVDAPMANIRLIMSCDEARQLIDSIPSIEQAWIASDRMREQEYKEAIKSNDPKRLVSIIKNLYERNRERTQQGKKSTAVDERYFKMAESTLYSELAVSLGRELEEMRQMILSLLG